MNATHTGLSPERASELAEDLNADPLEDWTYQVRHDPKGTGFSFVEIYDETGTYLGDL